MSYTFTNNSFYTILIQLVLQFSPVKRMLIQLAIQYVERNEAK